MASVLVAGGGTAGHVNPLLATAAELRSRGHAVVALGTAEGLEADLVPRADVELRTIPKVPLPRRLGASVWRVPGRLRAAVAVAAQVIDDHQVDVVVGFGGYVSAPAYLAARRRGVPIVVHEANARPGFANRLGARLTRHVAVTFAGTPLRHGVLTGLPLRAEVTALAQALQDSAARAHTQGEARESRGWERGAPVLLVTGGSLGAVHLNAAVEAAVPTLVAHGVHVWHLTGQGKAEPAMRARANLDTHLRGMYHVEEYSHQMATAFAAADAVVCRAGAATVCEVSALGLPALYVPLPHGNGEQALNAHQSVEAGAATILRDEDLTPASLELSSEAMVLDSKVNARMRAAALRVGISDGAARVADMVEAAV